MAYRLKAFVGEGRAGQFSDVFGEVLDLRTHTAPNTPIDIDSHKDLCRRLRDRHTIAAGCLGLNSQCDLPCPGSQRTQVRSLVDAWRTTRLPADSGFREPGDLVPVDCVGLVRI